jgi:hypothetical protein
LASLPANSLYMKCGETSCQCTEGWLVCFWSWSRSNHFILSISSGQPLCQAKRTTIARRNHDASRACATGSCSPEKCIRLAPIYRLVLLLTGLIYIDILRARSGRSSGVIRRLNSGRISAGTRVKLLSKIIMASAKAGLKC